MKKSTRLFLFILLCSGTVYMTSCSDTKEKSDIPELLERKKAIGPDDEKVTIKTTYDKAVDALKTNPDDLQQYVTLATAFVSEGRITGDNTYYSNSAIQMLDKVTDKTTANKDLIFQSLSLKSAVLLNMHQFKQALETAKAAVAINDFNAGIWGAMVDANVELGNYDEAVKNCDKMMTIRPDLRSYSRASYLRQIHGQNRGAIDAMRMAVEAGVTGAENTEWARTTLGDLYLASGHPDTAAMLYKASLAYRPNYPFALIGMARAEKANKNYDTAIAYTKSAIGVLSEAAFVSQLADLYELKGDAAKAKETRNDVVDLLVEGQKDEAKKAYVKHNASREIATAYMNAGNLDKALEYAKTDLEMRPNNIDANNLAAWIYYLKGDYGNAKIFADKMLVTKTQNANMLYEAGAIYAAAGDVTKGTQMMNDGLAVNPYVDQKIVSQTKNPVTITKQ